MRALRDREAVRKDLLARCIEEKRGLSILTAAANGRDEMADQAARHLGNEQDGGAPRAQLAGPQARERSPRAFDPDRLRILKVTPIPRGRVPIVPLHVLPGARQDHTAHSMRGRRIAADEAVRISVDMQPLMRIDRGALGIVDAGIELEGRGLGRFGDFDGALRGHVPGMIQIQVGLRARHQRCIRESRVGVFGGEPGDAAGLGHGGLHRRGRKVGGARRALALAEINRDAHAAVALVLERFDLPQTHAHRQARVLAYRRFRLGCAARARLLECALYDGCEVFPGGA